jgi:hypothetical protein
MNELFEPEGRQNCQDREIGSGSERLARHSRRVLRVCFRALTPRRDLPSGVYRRMLAFGLLGSSKFVQGAERFVPKQPSNWRSDCRLSGKNILDLRDSFKIGKPIKLSICTKYLRSLPHPSLVSLQLRRRAPASFPLAPAGSWGLEPPHLLLGFISIPPHLGQDTTTVRHCLLMGHETMRSACSTLTRRTLSP